MSLLKQDFDSVCNTVIGIIAHHLEIDREKILPGSDLISDLGMDSLDFPEVCIEIESTYFEGDEEKLSNFMKKTDEGKPQINTVEDLARATYDVLNIK